MIQCLYDGMMSSEYPTMVEGRGGAAAWRQEGSMQARVLVVASGKGGTGKSTVAVFAAQALAQKGKKVLVIELAEQLRNVDCIAGVSEQTVFDVSDWLSGRCASDKAMVQSPWCENLFIMSAPYAYAALELEALPQKIQQLLEQFDFIVIDTPTGICPCFQKACEVGELVLLVLTPDQMTLRAGRAMTEWIYEKNCNTKVRLVLNRVRQTGAKLDLDGCIDTVAAQLIAVIGESRQIFSSLVQQQPLPVKSEVWKAFENLASRICGQEVPLLFC